MPERLALFLAVAALAVPALAQDGISAEGPAAAGAGAEAFAARCAACHGDAGAGTPGLAPPLASAALWEGLGAEAPHYLAGVVLSGLAGPIRSGGQSYAGMIMPPQRQISDEEIALIGTYILQELGGTEAALEPGAVAALRDAPPSHAGLLALRPEIE